MVVDDDRAAGVELDPDLLETETGGVRHPSRGAQHQVGLDGVAGAELGRHRTVSVFSMRSTTVSNRRSMPRFLHFRREGVADVVVETAQEQRTAVVQHDLAAKAVEDAGKLDRDVAAAGDEDFLRLAVKVEDLVRCDAALRARDRRLERTAPGGDEDLVGGEELVADLDGVAIAEGGAALDDLALRRLPTGCGRCR